MHSYQHILCPADFSEYCEKAALRAAELARLYGARLTLFHVIAYFPVDFADDWISQETMIPMDDFKQRGEERLGALADKLDLPDVSQVVEIATASAKHEIVQYARQHEVDLIVLASHARHGISLLLGSTTTGVMHAAPCDVLTVRAK